MKDTCAAEYKAEQAAAAALKKAMAQASKSTAKEMEKQGHKDDAENAPAEHSNASEEEFGWLMSKLKQDWNGGNEETGHADSNKTSEAAESNTTADCATYGHISETNYYNLGTFAGNMVSKLFGSQIVS